MGVQTNSGDSRALLAAWRTGDLGARDQLFALFYPELRRSAAAMIRRERGTSLSTRDLIQETTLRLVKLERIAWEDVSHFRALTATMMRRALLDNLRNRRRAKRDFERVTLVTAVQQPQSGIDTEALGQALDRLSVIDRSHADIVEMRYFGGMDIAAIASVMALSESTVKRRWSAARMWLADALQR